MAPGPLQDITPFDFDELADHLLEQGLDSSPSILHGCLCGVLAGGGMANEKTLAHPDKLADLGVATVSQLLELPVHGELAEQLGLLCVASAAAMVDEEFSFHPLLPDDDLELVQRTQALADWCSGFLTGHTGVAAAAGAVSDAAASEMLSDIGAIAEAGVDEESDEDESEGSYIELVEYLRVAVLNVHAAAQGAEVSSTATPPPVH